MSRATDRSAALLVSSGGQLAWLSIAKPDTLRKEGVDLMVAGKLAAQRMTYMKKGEMINNTKNLDG